MVQIILRKAPFLTLRAPIAINLMHASASDPAILHRYFDLLQEDLEQNDLLDQACQIFNIYETGMPLDVKRLLLIKAIIIGQLYHLETSLMQITVVAWISTAGSLMPPTVILDCKSLPPLFKR